jgi:N-acetylglucosaminyldiphosphoundecaprenol N-acetyl-beta-D-mannosaminyltransferase
VSHEIRRRIGALDFTVLPFGDAVRELLDASDAITEKGHPGLAVHFANAYNVALARKDRDYARVMQSGDFVFSDGVPITWVGKRAYPDTSAEWDRVYGPDVMTTVFASSQPSESHQPHHYLLGSTPHVLEALQRKLSARFPNALIVGTESPPFREPTHAELTERNARISDSGATMVWVGLGTPKQDYEVARLARDLPVVALAVGAAFDFLAGTTPQAPRWMQRNGLEWAYRLASEPRRLGTRYLWGNSMFIMEAARTLRR